MPPVKITTHTLRQRKDAGERRWDKPNCRRNAHGLSPFS